MEANKYLTARLNNTKAAMTTRGGIPAKLTLAAISLASHSKNLALDRASARPMIPPYHMKVLQADFDERRLSQVTTPVNRHAATKPTATEVASILKNDPNAHPNIARTNNMPRVFSLLDMGPNSARPC